MVCKSVVLISMITPPDLRSPDFGQKSDKAVIFMSSSWGSCEGRVRMRSVTMVMFIDDASEAK